MAEIAAHRKEQKRGGDDKPAYNMRAAEPLFSFGNHSRIFFRRRPEKALILNKTIRTVQKEEIARHNHQYRNDCYCHFSPDFLFVLLLKVKPFGPCRQLFMSLSRSALPSAALHPCSPAEAFHSSFPCRLRQRPQGDRRPCPPLCHKTANRLRLLRPSFIARSISCISFRCRRGMDRSGPPSAPLTAALRPFRRLQYS